VGHKFNFTVRNLGDRFATEAFEIRDIHPGGFEFSAIDDIDEEPFERYSKQDFIDAEKEYTVETIFHLDMERP
jgi:hypothetical protein